MFILVDGEDHENEGDLIISSRSGLPLMAQRNRSHHSTAFTRLGGLGAHDRHAINPALGTEGIVTPGRNLSADGARRRGADARRAH